MRFFQLLESTINLCFDIYAFVYHNVFVLFACNLYAFDNTNYEFLPIIIYARLLKLTLTLSLCFPKALAFDKPPPLRILRLGCFVITSTKQSNRQGETQSRNRPRPKP